MSKRSGRQDAPKSLLKGAWRPSPQDRSPARQGPPRLVTTQLCLLCGHSPADAHDLRCAASGTRPQGQQRVHGPCVLCPSPRACCIDIVTRPYRGKASTSIRCRLRLDCGSARGPMAPPQLSLEAPTGLRCRSNASRQNGPRRSVQRCETYSGQSAVIDRQPPPAHVAVDPFDGQARWRPSAKLDRAILSRDAKSLVLYQHGPGVVCVPS